MAKSEKKEKTTRSKKGRPTLYKPEYCAIAFERCTLGSTNQDLADYFAVDIESIKRWMREIEDFRTAVHQGRDSADANVIKSLYLRATGYEHKAHHFSSYEGDVEATEYTKHHPPDIGAIKFWLMNRRGKEWKEYIRQEISGPDGAPVQVAKVEWEVFKPKETE